MTSTSSPPAYSVQQWIEISVGDKPMPLYVCTPALGRPKAAILVLQEIFGVGPHIRQIAERFAEAGYLALAPDLFHRQGSRFEAPYSDQASASERAQRMSEEQAMLDIERVLATLDQGLRVGVVGFCMGGRLAFRTAFNDRVSASVSFYGGRIVEKALQWTQEIRCPMLLFFGEKDGMIPQSDVLRIRGELMAHGKDHEIVIYPKAGHAFMREGHEAFEPQAAADAWERTLAFFRQNLGSGD